MSFGFGVGDFLAVSQLAWKLYHDCYVVSRGAPQEFQLLLQEITTLSQSIKLLELEAQDSNSTLVRSGEDRVRMVKEMLSRVEVTLKELEKHAKKYEKLGDFSRSKVRKHIWAKFKWSIDAPDLDALRNKLVYHNGIINLLLTSCANSSLQRIESSNQRLERRFCRIDELVQKFESQGSLENPSISAINHKALKKTLLSAKLMENAEVGKRRWSAIGVDEWIQAGRWWLLKSQSDLSTEVSSDWRVSHQAYANLVKASWILIDVIAKHPQFNLLDPSIQYDAEVLAEAIRDQLEDMDSSKLQKPIFEDLQVCDLSIWETQTKGALLQPSKRNEPLNLSGKTHHSWETEEEQVLFQRFAYYQASKASVLTSCVILFVAKKSGKRASVIIRDQSWTTLATFEVGGDIPEPCEESVSIGEQTILLPTHEDAEYLSVLWEATDEYVLHCITLDHDHDTVKAIVLLCAIKRDYDKVIASLLKDMRRLDDETDCSTATSKIGLRYSAMELASSRPSGKRVARVTSMPNSQQSLLYWADKMGYNEIVKYLLQRKLVSDIEQKFPRLPSIVECSRQGLLEMVVLHASERGFEGVDRLEKGCMFTALQIAAKIGNTEMVDCLITAGANINAPARVNGRTALQATAEAGHEAVVDKLLQAGADVNALHARSNGLTALQAAAGRGYEVVVDKLLQAGAGVNALPAQVGGRTALQAAAEGGHKAVVDKLLQAGANVHQRPAANSGGRTALQAAAGGGHEAVVDKLLQAGADVNEPHARCNGRTALQAAAGGGHEAVIDKLLQAGADVNALPARSKGLTALQAAAGGGHGAVVDKLLQVGADVNALAADSDGRTALQAAAEEGHEAVVDKLLQVGADVNALAADSDGRTALQAAAEEGHEAVVDKLFEAGANVNALHARSNGRTALQAAAGGGHQAVVDKLLQAGADVNVVAADFGGRTSLQAAAEGGHLAVIDKLLQAGADVNALAADSDGRTALQAAAAGGHKAVVDKLLQVGADVNGLAAKVGGPTALQAAAGSGHLAVINKLLQVGAHVNALAVDFHGRTALQAAAGGGHEAVVDKLLQVGADVNAPIAKYNGRTALQAASGGGYEAVVDKLLQAGADVNAPAGEVDGRTALQAAAEEGHQAVVDKLLQAGADVNVLATSYRGRTALQAAAGGGHLAVVDMLLQAGANINIPAATYGGRTALQAAAEEGHQAVVDKLSRAQAIPW